MRRPLIAFLLLSSCVAQLAWADPGGSRRLQYPQFQPAPLESAPGQAAPALQAQAERRPQFQLPEHSYAAIDSEGGSGSERGRRPGRLSPEERRALRRQINEAGSDLYTPGH